MDETPLPTTPEGVGAALTIGEDGELDDFKDPEIKEAE